MMLGEPAPSRARMVAPKGGGVGVTLVECDRRADSRRLMKTRRKRRMPIDGEFYGASGWQCSG